ncbi:FMN-binding negative transcriptional regulator [Noviherbaspirillum pedocola]|uniref:FMN-binding negative transcriptional regulator n=1 Tax=Noviherbaspirillum pedocola TaxID=2801341 RepID=A0A934W8C8_9BURK|nr:FMN-binding negative transcriptional regulator [Noviherbaspirillum pedocola]MBK4736648.1 FMN-binding negative transcriptional regulator [Noviherbaspirillum pedocola]
MYLPAHFEETELAAMHALMRAHPLGTLVLHGSAGLVADHLPFLLDTEGGGPGILLAHVARANALWRDALAGQGGAMVLFQGPSAYVSPNFYPSKAETHRVVPTYNYSAVHAWGRITVRDDARWLRGLLARLTRRFEADGQAQTLQPWRIGDAPADFIEAQLQKIVGIEIAIERMEGKVKMSQNRSDTDRRGVIEGLRRRAQGEDGLVAEEVERRLQEDC